MVGSAMFFKGAFLVKLNPVPYLLPNVLALNSVLLLEVVSIKFLV